MKKPMRAAKSMTTGEIKSELDQLGKRWDAFNSQEDDEGMSGSPGEWMIERMGELETELGRRGESA